MKFVVRKNGFNVIDQLWLDCTGKQEFTDQNQVIECHDQGLAAIVDGRRYTSSRGRVDYTEIERQDPVSVVIKAAGTLGNGSDEKLYYKVWIKAWADSQEVEVSFNIAKKDGETWDHFYQIGSVSIDLPIRKGRDITYAFGGKFGAHEGKVKGSSSIYQKSSDSYELLINEKTVASVRSGKSDKCQNLGWADIRSAGKGIGVVYRWFWQNFPSAIIANEDGKISVQVWAKYHEPLKLYTGVAKTTDIRFYFHEDCESLADVGDRLKSFQLLKAFRAERAINH
jgi:hypothetical protein